MLFAVRHLLILALLASCAEQPTRDCYIDSNLVNSWSDYASLEHPPLPFTKVYGGCDKHVIYVAAKHENDPESDTYSQIAQAFETYQIGIAIVEGFPAEYGINPAGLLEYANDVEGTPQDAESYFTIRRIMHENGAFRGGEPTDIAIYEHIEPYGFDYADLLGFYITRNIEQWQRSGQISSASDPALDIQIKQYSQNFVAQMRLTLSDVETVASLANFKEWYEARNSIDFSTGFRFEDAWPSGAIPDPRPMNDLSDKIADARDQYILSVISEAATNFDTILVVYGGSHHAIQAAAFDAAFVPE